MKTNIFSLACVLLLVLPSCNEDYLDRSPSDQVISSDFFTLEKDLVYALNAAYASIGFNSWGQTVDYGYSTDLLRIEATTDNALDHHSWNRAYRLGDGTASTLDDYATARWRERYRGVQRVNRILEGADGITNINEDYKARLLSESKFLRAFFYFDLVYLFGDVPFVTKDLSPDDTKPIENTEGEKAANEHTKRVDKTIILDAIVKDLTESAVLLPKSYSSDELGRATKGAALSLKARILLYQKKWEEAAVAAKEVMDLGVYNIYPSYENMFTYTGINNSEVIFDLQELKDKQYNFTIANYGPNSVGGWSSGCPLQSLVDSYECIDGNTIDESPLFDPNNPYEKRDPRLNYSILYPGHEWRGGVYNSIPGATYPGQEIVKGDDLTDGTGGQWNKTGTGYNWLKYITEGDIDSGDNWNGSIHFILIRYAEVLLTYAEAKIEDNDIDQSVYDAINEIRQRADVNMPIITPGKTQDQLRTILRRERRVELAFEGLRLMDIRRWEIAENVMPGVPEGLTYTDVNSGAVKTFTWGVRQFDKNKHYLWPIPQSEIGITHIKQNPGW